MPFGLYNAPATLEQLPELVLRGEKKCPEPNDKQSHEVLRSNVATYLSM